MANKTNFEKIYETSPELLDVSKWKTVLIDVLSDNDKATFLERKKAIEMYISRDYTTKEIQEETGILPHRLWYHFHRCLYTDEHGEIYGYRALVPFIRIKDYKRGSEDSGILDTKPSNFSGSFKKLLDKHPEIEEFIISRLLKKEKGIKEPKIFMEKLHKDFLNQCKANGVSVANAEYPFNTDSLGKRSLYRYVEEYKKRNASKFINESGKDANAQFFSSGIGKKNENIVRPFQRVEFDGHKLDVLAVVTVTNPEGDQVERVMGRFWLCMLIDVATRCILGYHISVNTEYNQFDILQTIENSIIPWKAKEFSVIGLEYTENGGFPSETVPLTRYALWDEIAFDNAKSHYAKRVQQKIEEVVGCNVVYGPAGTPTRRPFIERVFQTLEMRGLHRTPTTTGSNTKDPIRQNPEKNAIKYKVRFEEISELIEVLIHEYNGNPHSGNSYLSPLELMEQRINNTEILPRTASENISLTTFTTTKSVRGKMGSGRRPHINFEGAVYTNDVLAGNYELVNTKLTIEYDTKDVSKVRAFLPNGCELGYLYAKGGWNYKSHDLRTRKLINKAKNKNEIPDNDFIDPVTAFNNHLNEKAIAEKKSTNKLKNLSVTTGAINPDTKIDSSVPESEFKVTDALRAMKQGRKSYTLR